MRPDAVTLLRDLRPPDPPLAPDEAALERIVASPPGAPPRRRRRRVLRPAIVAVTAAAAAGLAILPAGSPDVLARTAQALTDEDTILHFRTEMRHRSDPAELALREPDAQVDARAEAWQADAGRRERYVRDGAGEYVRDWDAKLSMAYNAERDELIRHTDPDVFGPAAAPRSLDAPMPFGGSYVGDLARTLDRARRGEDDIHLVGETTVRGVEVYELRIDFEIRSVVMQGEPAVADPRDLPTRKVKASRTIYIDRETFLPVRVVERTEWPARGGDLIQSITDFVGMERLPRTPENEKLLDMSPHPGAKQITEGRV